MAQVEDFDDMEDDKGAIRASEAPSIKNKPPPKKPGPRTHSDSPGRPNSTRAAYLMPAYRYPIAVEGAHHPTRAQDYSVIINVRRAIQYGAAFSPAVDLENNERGQYVTSGIPANAIVQIQEPPTTEMGTPSEPHSRSTSGVPNPPRARPTHTPKTHGDGTDEEQAEALAMAANVENDLDRLPLNIMSVKSKLKLRRKMCRE